MDRALLVGINQYESNPSLSGCVNDINAVAAFLTEECGFAEKAIRQLSDLRATRKAMLEHIRALISGVAAGDRIVFHYSGHGSQLSTRDPQGEVDGLDEVICPTDYDNGNNAIRDKELHSIFHVVPPGVHFVWIADSCNSGDLSRDLRPTRFLPPHNDIAWRIHTAHARGMKPMTFRGAAKLLNLAFIAACQSNETAREAPVGDETFGALTYYLLRRLREADGLSIALPKIVADVTTVLAQPPQPQHPQLEGAPANTAEAFLGRVARAIGTVVPAEATTPLLHEGDIVFRGASVYLGDGRFTNLMQGNGGGQS